MKEAKKFLQKISVYLKIFFSILAAILLATLGGVLFYYTYEGKVYPRTQVLDLNISGLTQKEVEDIFEQTYQVPSYITLTYQGQKTEIPTKEIGLLYDHKKTAQQALSLYREKNSANEVLTALTHLTQVQHIPLSYTLNKNELEKHILVFTGQFTTLAKYPSVSVVNDSVVVEKGAPGTTVDIQSIVTQVEQNVQKNAFVDIPIHLTQIDPTLSEKEIFVTSNRAQYFIDKEIVLTFEEETFILDGSHLVSFISPPLYWNDQTLDKIIEEIALEIDRPAQNAIFNFSEGRVHEFTPSLSGYEVDRTVLKEKIVQTLEILEKGQKQEDSIALYVKQTEPEITTETVNNLGINEIIGTGNSTFRGSISARVHNISVASNKFNGTLIKPGETFSFNKILGDVSTLTGYKQAYVIRDGQTVLGDGGGVCQVSTTLFRAALNAGLPIAERRAHSYRVGYYEQNSDPGLDATVYDPYTDLKITNDTPGHILIQTTFNAQTSSLKFEIFGTNDGRVSTVTKSKISSVSPPPEDHYIDDPTLPAGQVKQIDWAAWGAKVSFDYSVERNGEIIYEKTFYSNYQPWQAKFLRGTGPV